MRCYSCHKISRAIICKECHSRLLVTEIRRRTVGTLEVISLFRYKSIEPFLLTKHTPVGHRIFDYLGKYFVAPFLYEFAENTTEPFYVVGVDEQIRHGYSHTALLTKSLRHHMADVLHAKLLAGNHVNYAGKTLQYRLDNPRDFYYSGQVDREIVLVDDIITTGATLQQAQESLTARNTEALFAVAIADAQD